MRVKHYLSRPVAVTTINVCELVMTWVTISTIAHLLVNWEVNGGIKILSHC